MTNTTTTLQVRKARLDEVRFVESPNLALEAGQIRVRVDRFSLTANNITYAAMGEAMNYWQFYPSGDDAWGVIPVWGFADVVASTLDSVAVGERLWGYWPLASHAVLTPVKVDARGFIDGAPQRQALHVIYNQVSRTTADPFYTAPTEDLQALLRPLFVTSFLIDDFLADQAFFGARRLLLSSASSKTAYGTAHCLRQRAGVEVVGLTSPRNRAFCEGLGCYSRVLTYGELATLPAEEAAVYVDFAGSAALRRQVHEHLHGLTYDCAIGLTHHDAMGSAKGLPGPAPQLFFAPAQAKKRHAELGPDAFGQAMLSAWTGFVAQAQGATPPWIQVEQHQGLDDVLVAYRKVLSGQDDARTGHMLSIAAAAGGG